MSISELQVQTTLKELIDPSLQKDYVSTKAARNIKIDSNNVILDVVLPFPAKSVLAEIKQQVEAKIKTIPGVGSVTANVSSKIVAHAAQRGVKPVPGVRNIIAVASGKGPAVAQPYHLFVVHDQDSGFCNHLGCLVINLLSYIHALPMPPRRKKF